MKDKIINLSNVGFFAVIIYYYLGQKYNNRIDEKDKNLKIRL